MSQKYSVLMSLYTKENPNWFRLSLDSMINQTVKPDEIVLIIDGPITYSLKEVVKEYEIKYSDLLKVVPLEKNVGLGNALNIGLEHCKNDLIARMDTDDISLPSRCEKQLEKFKNDYTLDIVGTMVDEFYDNPTNVVSSRVVPTTHDNIKKFARRRSPFNHPTVMYRRKAVIDSGKYGLILRKEDITLFSRMVNEGHKAANIDESLVLYRSDHNNFKRRKNWKNCISYIQAQNYIWKCGNCSTWDLIVVTISQIFMFSAPMWLLKYISNKFLRTVK